MPLRQITRLASVNNAQCPRRISDPPWNLVRENLELLHSSHKSRKQLWSLLCESGEELDLQTFVGLLYGREDHDVIAAAWLELVNKPTMFRIRQDRVSARPLNDLRRLQKERRRRKASERLEKAWMHLLTAPSTRTESSTNPVLLERLDKLREIASGQAGPESLAPELCKSLMRAGIAVERNELRQFLHRCGCWGVHQLPSLEGSSWSQGFGEDILLECRTILEQCDSEHDSDKSRLDMTSQRCVTIDDADTYEIDDAIGLETRADGCQRIWIHIADPGRLVLVGSLLDLEAQRRASSLYLTTGSLPMFPEELSSGPFSLRAGRRSAAWSTWVELDSEGDIADFGILRTWVCPTYRLSYDDADELIELAPPEDKDLAELDQLLAQRRQWRQQHGGLLMELPEGRLRQHDGSLEVVITEPGASRRLVAEAMILAGAIAARFGYQEGLALPYRGQPKAELPTTSELQCLPRGAVRFAAIRRCLSRGVTGPVPMMHFSLGLSAYAQVTSPIRRYSDLMAQRQIAARLEGEPELDPHELQQQIDTINLSLREGIAITREDQRHWQQVWFADRSQSSWSGIFLRWLRSQDQLGLVRIESLAMDLPAICPTTSQPGFNLRIHVRQANPLLDQLQLTATSI
ncbi:hypothetical protein OMCYN_01401 [cyanobiont of Ornithocercus magnificus]|nr:hypothetical protein OMCYN_01401 [cyanobiont of Ornithocercus magnificus]